MKSVDRNHESGAEKSKKPQKNYLVRIFWISRRRWMDFHHSPHFHQGYIIGIYYIKGSTLTPVIRRKGCTLEQTSSLTCNAVNTRDFEICKAFYFVHIHLLQGKLSI